MQRFLSNLRILMQRFLSNLCPPPFVLFFRPDKSWCTDLLCLSFFSLKQGVIFLCHRKAHYIFTIWKITLFLSILVIIYRYQVNSVSIFSCVCDYVSFFPSLSLSLSKKKKIISNVQSYQIELLLFGKRLRHSSGINKDWLELSWMEKRSGEDCRFQLALLIYLFFHSYLV